MNVIRGTVSRRTEVSRGACQRQGADLAAAGETSSGSSLEPRPSLPHAIRNRVANACSSSGSQSVIEQPLAAARQAGMRPARGEDQQ